VATGAITGVPTEIDRRIGEYVDRHADEMIGFLKTVVSTRSLWGDIPQLAAMGRVLGERMTHAGVIVTYPDSGTPGAPNVLAYTGNPASSRCLLFNGHFDVYPPSNSWTFDPFSTPIRDGKLYGPGSTDMKGGTTAMVVATTVLSALGLPKNGKVALLAVPNHFEGGEGTRRALDAGLTAEAAIVCEPTDLDICSSQRGILYMLVHVKGVSAHTTHTAVGVNAIEKAIPFMQALRSPAFLKPDHDDYGAQKILNIAMIEGGLRRCLIPEHCTITLDVRFSPSATADEVLADVRQVIAECARRDPAFLATVEPHETCVRNPRSPMDWIRHPIDDTLAAAHNAFATTGARHACHPAWPDTPVFNERGIPAITYGPGSKYCYWDDEFVPTDEYLQAIKVYAATAARWFDAPS
jgi:acetylornithine deacetylase/succinyl-diaminopimelate desuccinylase-like protein